MNQMKPSTRTLPALFLMHGLLAIFLALFAHAVGVDPNPDWGRSRVVLFVIGLLLFAAAVLLFWKKSRFVLSEDQRLIFLLGHVWAIVITIYVFFITFGTFTSWRASTQYYALLADGLRHGRLHVDVEPGSELLAAEDPYSSESRPPFEEEVWDLSLYKGKLYLYWGPVPALLLVPVQFITSAKLTDMYLVFLFLCGLLIVNTLYLLKLRDLFFSHIPGKNLVASVFLIGLILPVLWALNIPDVYEAAISGGQFFLLGGIYFLLLAFEKTPRNGYLFLAGSFWALSVGSRAIHVFSVLFMAAWTSYWLWKRSSKPRDWKGLFPHIAALMTPLIIGAMLIGGYNWARFDSPLEFGLRYQITIYNLNRDMALTFQPDYFPLNFYGYFLQPFSVLSTFPFIKPAQIHALMDALGVSSPKLFAGGPVTGVLFSMPFLLLAVIPLLKQRNRGADLQSLKTLVLSLLGFSFLITSAAILFYFYQQTRFMLDFVSQAALLAIVGYWMIVGNPRTPKVARCLVSVLLGFTLIASFLLSFSSETGRMQKLNPALIQQINSFFTMPK